MLELISGKMVESKKALPKETRPNYYGSYGYGGYGSYGYGYYPSAYSGYYGNRPYGYRYGGWF